jgi:hypothetical protein
MAARSGGIRMGACQTSPTTAPPGKATISAHRPHTDRLPGFLAVHDPPPPVGVQLVRPRLRRKRLHLRALQLDTSHATATNRPATRKSAEEQSAHPDDDHASGGQDLVRS